MTEQTYVRRDNGTLCRPFQSSAQICCRGYSLPLQRVITDFGADLAFGRVDDKLQEHYGIRVPHGAIVTLTEKHARAFTDDATRPAPRTSTTPLTLVAQTDGSMIPVVETSAGENGTADRRKHRKLFWKEAKLTLVRRADEVTPLVGVTLGDPTQAGESLKQLAQVTGLTPLGRVHGVGDGAPWIADQIEVQFGAQGRYLIDFYHLCEYLAAAAKVCAREAAAAWMTQQQERLKAGHLSDVVQVLAPFVEPDTVPIEAAPVRQCYRYITNRPGQFRYHDAIAANLPIGSGEVESAHRYVIQERLKLAGAWWRADNAQAMLNLRTARANCCWDRYWDALAA